MRRLLQIALVLGALVGLFGQSLALAHFTPAPGSQQGATPSDDCMEAMAPSKPQQDPAPPCKGITLDCIAAMGCTVPVLLGDLPELAPAPTATQAPPWRASPILLSGRSLAPDPDPPSRS